MSPPHRQSVARISGEWSCACRHSLQLEEGLRLQEEVVPASEVEPDGWKAAGKFTVVLEACMPTTTMPGAAPRSSPAVG
jgi:hypothetical protein